MFPTTPGEVVVVVAFLEGGVNQSVRSSSSFLLLLFSSSLEEENSLVWLLGALVGEGRVGGPYTLAVTGS